VTVEQISSSDFIGAVSFDAAGLVPAIAQDAKTGEVLMLAWMNRDALTRTLETGDATYWSRSRKELWRKGATSGHTQRLVEAYVDCDGDTLLLKVEQVGPACHTGAPTCFFRKMSKR
jgi:phosphoribosyl-AMP cyclohydrolase